MEYWSARVSERWSIGTGINRLPRSNSSHQSITPKLHHSSSGRRLLDNFEGAAHSLLRAAGQEQRTNRVNRHPLPANYLTDILRIQAQFINRRPLALDRRYS